MKKTFFSESFGCRVNEAEREEINRQLLKKGFQYTSDDPTIYFINTCAVTAKAEREARQRIYQIRRKFLNSKIIVTGCAATYWQKNNLYNNIPADLIVDNLNKEFLIKIIENRFLNKPAIDPTNCEDKKINYEVKPFLDKFLTSGRILIKIQDGCQRFCSFCIVPYLRGLPKSVTIKDLILKIKNCQNQVKEVILTAINTEAYGYDTGEKFVDLLKKVIDETRVPRISLGSVHPWSINDDFYQFYKQYLPKRRLVDFFHIPIQSGSDKILRLMKRGYTKNEILEKIKQIKKINPLALIGTDIIVGFLEEDEKDFLETFNFLKQAPIDKFHIFRFCKRKNTAAFFMAKRLKEPSPEVKKKRAKIITQLGKQKYERFLHGLLDKNFTCLFLDKEVEGFQRALLSNQIPILIKDKKYFPGEIKNVKIIEFKNGELFGKII
ncbi:MAG: MiaB/RimO family radical SAM methylthiotransferase [Microgenomates group bacterium]